MLETKDLVGIGLTILISGLPLVLLVGVRFGRLTAAVDTLQKQVAGLVTAVSRLNRDRERTGDKLEAVDEKVDRIARSVGGFH